MRSALLCVVLFQCLLPVFLSGQDKQDAIDRLNNFPTNFLSKINNKTASLDRQLTRQSKKYLQRLAGKESKLKDRLTKFDPAAANNLFSYDPQKQYGAFLQKLKSDSGGGKISASGEYLPYLDSLKLSLDYLKANPQLIKSSKLSSAEIAGSISQLQQLQAKMLDADQIKQFIAQRKEQISQYLSKYAKLPSGLTNAYQQYSKQAYFYRDQVRSFRESLNDPDKILKTALVLLNKIPAFSDFAKSNSLLGSLFNTPGSTNPNPLSPGLQTRDQLQTMLQDRMGVSGPKVFSGIQSATQSAQGQIDELRNKLKASGSGDLSNPDFQRNDQRNKSFLHRLEYGTGLQTTKNNYFFPITSDFSFSVEYKLNKTNVVGFAIAYKMGWGENIHHIRISSQGLGLRSFADIKIKKNTFLSGGFEFNFQKPFNSTHIFDHELANWTKSGLIGISRIVSIKSRVFKKAKLQILWDFLSGRQLPRTEPLKFRIGYSF